MLQRCKSKGCIKSNIIIILTRHLSTIIVTHFTYNKCLNNECTGFLHSSLSISLLIVRCQHYRITPKLILVVQLIMAGLCSWFTWVNRYNKFDWLI